MGLADFHCITQLIILYKSTFRFIIRFTIIGKTYKSIIIRYWTCFKKNSIINITDSSIIERFYTISTNYFFSVCCSKSSSPAVRMRGGLYTQFSIPVGERWSGYYGIIYTVIKMTLTMYPLSFAQHFIALILGAPEKAVALGVATFFIGLAFFGVDLAAEVQNLLVIALIAALVVFAVFGFPYVDLGNDFSNADGMFLSDGIGGFLTAVAYLGFATGGATVILGLLG